MFTFKYLVSKSEKESEEWIDSQPEGSGAFRVNVSLNSGILCPRVWTLHERDLWKRIRGSVWLIRWRRRWRSKGNVCYFTATVSFCPAALSMPNLTSTRGAMWSILSRFLCSRVPLSTLPLRISTHGRACNLFKFEGKWMKATQRGRQSNSLGY